MSTIKAGDRVEFNQNFGSRKTGDQGVVISVSRSGLTAKVKMESANAYGVYTAEPYTRRLSKVEDTPAVPEARLGLIEMVKLTSERVGTRNRNAILHSLAEEVGELNTEVAIENGTKKREASPDGVTGEAIDVLVVILDLLHLQLGEQITSQAFLDRVQSKLNKWEGK